MLKSRKHLPSYGDGVARVYTPRPKVTSFAAHENPDGLSDLIYEGTFPFTYSQIRESDAEEAESHGLELTLKLRGHKCPYVAEGKRMVIGDVLYDVYFVDLSTRGEAYVYLTGGKHVDINSGCCARCTH